MASFEIILGTTARNETSAMAREAPPTGSEWFDVVVDGERISAATQPEQAACLLRDLVSGAASVLEGRAPTVLVPLCDAPWELCVANHEGALALSLYRTGASPEVRLLDRRTDARDIVRQARAALASMEPELSPRFTEELGALIARLECAARAPSPGPLRGPDVISRYRTSVDRPLRIAFETVLPTALAPTRGPVRADLHALLFRGRVLFDVRGQRGELGNGFVFLHLERLLSLCRPLLDAAASRRSLHLRVGTAGATVALRLGLDGALALSIGTPSGPTFTAPALDPRDFATPVVEAALAIARAAVRADRSRSRNLRLRALRSEARAVKRILADLGRAHSKLNDDPAPYRASAVTASRSGTSREMDLGGAARLRYVARWKAEIEGVDLGSTLLCGERLVVPGAREVQALDRRTGTRLWSQPLPRAALAIAGTDILRLTPRGDVELRDVRSGDVIWSTRVAPRVGAPALAFTVNAAGLPPLVLVGEGERRVVALDLRTGEPRWRHAARHASTLRIRRVGRLVIMTSGDPMVTALDVATGEVVWRHVGEAPFALAPAIHRETVLVASGTAGRGPLRITALEAFTGEHRWSREHAGSLCSPPVGASGVAAAIVADREGTHAVGFDLATGEDRFAISLGSAPLHGAPVALTAFDSLLVANLGTGRVTGIDASSGEIAWSRVLSPPVADDAPRRLDVQLRAGALFVPQSSLAVLRPHDGAAMADVSACDLVPDLVRVDENCSLYVGEESGHIGCYELGSRLAIVRPMSN